MKFACLLAATCGLAFASVAGQAADPVTKAPAKLLLEQRRVEIAPDASRVDSVHLEMQVLTQSAIQPLGQQAISYSDTSQDVVIDEAYTRKTDGTKIAVEPSAIITQQRPGNTSVQMLTDQKQKVVVFPNVEVGDTLVSRRTVTSKPLFPGLFSSGAAFPQSFEVVSSETVFVTPKTLPLYFDTKDVVVEKGTDGDKLVYTVRMKVEHPKPVQLEYVSAFDRSPYIFVSTMKTWAEFAKLYASMVAPKLAVTPKLQAKADEITAGVTGQREQAKAIYDWVAAHIRYVGIEFGQGGFVPHDPEAVMTNAYGDCKDHAILFATLLKAKGIAADLVAIHASDNYTVPNVAYAGAFNHMINYIPSLGLYTDTTQRAMAFGYLPRGEYGKSVLHVGVGLRKIPLLAQKDSAYRYSEHLTLDANGVLTSRGTLTASGVAAGLAQRDDLRIRAAGSEKTAAEVLEKRGLIDATGKFEMPAGETPVAAYTSTTHYTAPKQQAWLAGAPFVLPKGLMTDSLIGEFWLGPMGADKYKKSEILPCLSGTGEEEFTLDLPAGKKVAALPADTKIEAGGLSYQSHWSLDGHAVTVKRTLALSFKDVLCRGEQATALHNALAGIKSDFAKTIALAAE